MYSEDPTEDQILHVFKSIMSFRVLRELLHEPRTVGELSEILKQKDTHRIYSAIDNLKKFGLVKVKEYKLLKQYTKIAVFMPTIKTIDIHLGQETTIRTDTKLTLHGVGDEAHD